MVDEKEQFAVVELMGHRRFGAQVTEVDRFGIKMMRAEIQVDPPIVQFVHPQSIYALTVCTVEQARAVNDRFMLEQAVPMTIVADCVPKERRCDGCRGGCSDCDPDQPPLEDGDE
jgi:hypothetical protein